MNESQIFELIANNIRQIVPELNHEVIERNSILSPLGLDSIGRAELIEIMLEQFDLKIPRQEFHSACNLGELADLFAAKLATNRL